MEAIYKVGDRVYHIMFGWGIINRIVDIHLEIKFDKHSNIEEGPLVLHFNLDGKYFFDDLVPTLSFTEYTLQGFSQLRPRKQPKLGSLCLFADDEEQFNSNIGVIGILYDIIDGNYYQNTDDGDGFEYCKQIEIKEV